MFFQKPENIRSLETFLKKVEPYLIEDNEKSKKLDISRKIINAITNNPYEWDEKCKFNIQDIGNVFIENISGFRNEEFQINNIYVCCYRFLCEYEFFLEKGTRLSVEFLGIKSEIESAIPNKHQYPDSEIIYASYFMPAQISREAIKNDYLQSIKNLELNFSEANNTNEKINKELEEKIKQVESIKLRLDEYKTAFNFVGLHKGFDNLVSQKNEEKFRNSWLLTTLALLVIAPIAAASYYAISQLLKGTPISIDYLISAAPVLSLEIVLIYFFRIVLANNRSLKTQIMQLELRKSLCEFIQSYADYAKEIKTKDHSSLDKFENVIFSGIIAEPEKLPSTYDGLEQIGSLIKELRKP